jgi:hypothetical protein
MAYHSNYLTRLVKSEIYLTYGMMKSNIDAAIVPFFIFTLASLLHRGAQPGEMLYSMARKLQAHNTSPG